MENETIADIVTEFREMVHKSVDGIIAVKADVIADRIEAAWNREHGNAAAMRAALYMMRRISDEMNGETFGKGDEEIVKGWANTLRYYSDKALSEPPRNCDVGTAEEQNTRHGQFCYAQMKRNNHCCGPCPCHKFVNGEAQACTLLWAQMPYEEKEGGTDGVQSTP